MEDECLARLVEDEDVFSLAAGCAVGARAVVEGGGGGGGEGEVVFGEVGGGGFEEGGGGGGGRGGVVCEGLAGVGKGEEEADILFR